MKIKQVQLLTWPLRMLRQCCPVLVFFWMVSALSAAERPNIVFILADDLGYGDVQANYPQGKIRTPHLDKLAAQGIRFTDAHTTSSVCTPTRYSLLTGRYNWRSRLQSGVLGGLSPRLIEPGRLTVAELLRQHGYATAAIGKWHLGMDWALRPDRGATERDNIEKPDQVWNVDFTKEIKNGPNSVGFDYFFGISASLDMVPYTFIENNRVVSVPTHDAEFPMTFGRTEGKTRRGPTAPGFQAEQVLPTLTAKAVDWIGNRAAATNSGKPFFLYLALNSPHTPILPTEDWRKKSGISYYADFVMQTDWSVGQVLRALDEKGVAENTLVFFASDNGCSPAADLKELRAAGHEPNGPWRGHKADIWEGGHRVPFIVRWPKRIQAGQTNASLVSLVDLMATCADLLEVPMPENAAEDSFSFLPLLLGREAKDGSPKDAPENVRPALVHHSINGRFAIRQGRWKLALCPGSGGWSAPRDAQATNAPPVQLYDLEKDPGERTNLEKVHPEIVRELSALLEKYVDEGRSRPGPPQNNDAKVDIWKRLKRSR